ncbi:hypothetical protein [Dysgonomonas macrotermitis]|uniref:Uncharacterized protein n=1 Tax=Dysgonomonas macrotermitis TaxID=1346286 RepID=A0A1M5BBF2_9BACT|nr:hypothetical protein [Dysgonomonas macrotermitis]SHF39716.1 hypothetical protein SAMN05444362_1069 [Dysgonomonas macrotermitis]
MLDKTFKVSRIIYFLCVIVSVCGLIYNFLYTTKYITIAENPILERWAIIITLAGIYGALRLLHPKLKNPDRENLTIAVKKYITKYYIRLGAVFAIYMFNMLCFSFTGIKNFIYLSIITIFAMFLCAPNKKHFENETKYIDQA